MQPKVPRPSDAAVAVARLMVDLAIHLNKREYPVPSDSLARSLISIYIAQAVLVATVDNHGVTATEIEKKLHVPRSTVVDHLKVLVDQGLVVKTRTLYRFDLDKLDHMVTEHGPEHVAGILQRAYEELCGYLTQRKASKRRDPSE